jgi:hypothetical protein
VATHKIHLIFIAGKERVQNKPEYQICNHHSTCTCLKTRIQNCSGAESWSMLLISFPISLYLDQSKLIYFMVRCSLTRHAYPKHNLEQVTPKSCNFLTPMYFAVTRTFGNMTMSTFSCWNNDICAMISTRSYQIRSIATGLVSILIASVDWKQWAKLKKEKTVLEKSLVCT